MEIKSFEESHIIRIDKGEEIISSLRDACEKLSIKSGLISGIGAVDEVEIGFYDVTTQKYHPLKKEEQFELTNLSGNVSTIKGQIYLHLHATLADKDFKLIGGHLSSARVGGTCEITLIEISARTERKKDSVTGLNIYDFDD